VTALPPIRRALVSVSDKTDLDVLAQILIDCQVEVLSTGGTYTELERLGVAVVKVSEFTGTPEILGGRVKTLHPKIHGGILGRPTAAHEAEMRQHGIYPIDLVVVNLYPFRETIARPGCSFEDAIENIDIGGPAMIRASAKNWERVAIVVDPADYRKIGEALAGHGRVVPAELRRALARKAFAHTAGYDAAIAGYFARFDDAGQAIGDALPDALFVAGKAAGELRYGENPHQPARWYAVEAGEPAALHRATVHQGKALSYNNLLDADAALGLARDLSRLGPAAAVIKHVSPCGAAVGRAGEAIADVYLRAREADAESAFGGIVALSQPVDRATAERIAETFLEVVIAPAFAPEALAALASKKNLRLLSLSDMLVGAGPEGQAPLRLRSIAGGLLAQRDDVVSVGAGQGRVVTKRAPTAAELRDLELAQLVGKSVRSNAIVLREDGATGGIGGGQTSRVEASRQAAGRAGPRARGAALASDAFFPFRDGVDAAAAAGVTAIVQPGGSVRDEEVIAAADEHGLAMVFTGQRHFRH
jgi:phosphoribosylaminoimidazolecarboxamide formyltransferase/IMP cyclohydrolase